MKNQNITVTVFIPIVNDRPIAYVSIVRNGKYNFYKPKDNSLNRIRDWCLKMVGKPNVKFRPYSLENTVGYVVSKSSL